MDIDSRYRPNVVGDNRRMPFMDECFDVVVYDPPHIPNQGKDGPRISTRGSAGAEVVPGAGL